MFFAPAVLKFSNVLYKSIIGFKGIFCCHWGYVPYKEIYLERLMAFFG